MARISILIPTMEGRESLLSRLLFGLKHQMSDDVEVLIDNSDRRMGDKLNDMFRLAKGKYVVCVDDDDYLSGDYVATLLPMTDEDHDYIGYDIVSMIYGDLDKIYSHRLENRGVRWDNSPERGVSPKCLIKAEIAKRVTFGNEYTADREYVKQVEKLCKTGAYIPRALYYYDNYPTATLFSEVNVSPIQRSIGLYPYDKNMFTWVKMVK